MLSRLVASPSRLARAAQLPRELAHRLQMPCPVDMFDGDRPAVLLVEMTTTTAVVAKA